jgi:hypothetical protein
MDKFKIQLLPETVEMIAREMESIPDKYQKPFNSTHEGYAVLLEEVREIEHVVFFGEKESKVEAEAMRNGIGEPFTPELRKAKASMLQKSKLREEAVQIAAMACRIIQELTV